MVIAPVRDALLVFWGTLSVSRPDPLPFAGDTTVNQEAAELFGVHWQPATPVTLTCACCEAALRVTVGGDALNVQATPDWVTGTCWPAIVSVPLRAVPVGLGWGVNVTTP